MVVGGYQMVCSARYSFRHSPELIQTPKFVNCLGLFMLLYEMHAGAILEPRAYIWF